MSVYSDIRANRRLIWAGIWIGYALSAAGVVIRLVNTDPLGAGEVIGSVALGAATAIAPTLAWISLDRRPGLLPGAALAALVGGFVSFLFLPVGLLVALMWMRAWSRRARVGEASRALWWARVGLGFGVALASFSLWMHLDPVCTETYSDGRVVEVDAAEHGYPTGWRFGIGDTSSGSGSSQSGFEGPVSSRCTSDTLVWWEGVLSLAITAVVVWAGTRWPVNDPVEDRSSAGA